MKTENAEVITRRVRIWKEGTGRILHSHAFNLKVCIKQMISQETCMTKKKKTPDRKENITKSIITKYIR